MTHSAFLLVDAPESLLPPSRLSIIAWLVWMLIFPYSLVTGLLFIPLKEDTKYWQQDQIPYAFFFLIEMLPSIMLPIAALNANRRDNEPWFIPKKLMLLHCLLLPGIALWMPYHVGINPVPGLTLGLGAFLLLFFAQIHVYYYYKEKIVSQKKTSFYTLPQDRAARMSVGERQAKEKILNFWVVFKLSLPLLVPPATAVLMGFSLIPVISVYLQLLKLQSTLMWIVYAVVLVILAFIASEVPLYTVYEVLKVKQLELIEKEDEGRIYGQYIIDLAFEVFFNLAFPTLSRTQSLVPYILIGLLHAIHEMFKCLWIIKSYQNWMLQEPHKQVPSSVIGFYRKVYQSLERRYSRISIKAARDSKDSPVSSVTEKSGTTCLVKVSKMEAHQENPGSQTSSECKWVHIERKRLFLRIWASINGALFFIIFYTFATYLPIGQFFPFQNEDIQYYTKSVVFAGAVVCIRFTVTWIIATIAEKGFWTMKSGVNEFWKGAQEGYFMLKGRKTGVYMFAIVMAVNTATLALYLKQANGIYYVFPNSKHSKQV